MPGSSAGGAFGGSSGSGAFLDFNRAYDRSTREAVKDYNNMLLQQPKIDNELRPERWAGNGFQGRGGGRGRGGFQGGIGGKRWAGSWVWIEVPQFGKIGGIFLAWILGPSGLLSVWFSFAEACREKISGSIPAPDGFVGIQQLTGGLVVDQGGRAIFCPAFSLEKGDSVWWPLGDCSAFSFATLGNHSYSGNFFALVCAISCCAQLSLSYDIPTPCPHRSTSCSSALPRPSPPRPIRPPPPHPRRPPHPHLLSTGHSSWTDCANV